MDHPAATHRPTLFIFALSSLVLLGCAIDAPTGQEEALLLEGNLLALEPEIPVTGSAAAVTQFGNTDISIGAEGLEPRDSHGWLMREGTCQEEGALVGAANWYTDIEADEDGSASAVIRGAPVELVRNRTYAVELFQETGQDGPVLACADLEEQQF